MRTSSVAPSPIDFVSTWIAARGSERRLGLARPVVSLPSDSSTIRFWASSGNSADARRSAAPMSVADVTGAEAMRSMSRSSAGQSLDERAPCRTPRCRRRRLPASAQGCRGRMRGHPHGPPSPTLSERSTTNTVASRSTGRTRRKPARANTSAESRSVRTSERDAAPADPGASSSAEMENERQRQGRDRAGGAQSGASKAMPIRHSVPTGPASRDPSDAPAAGHATSRW